MGRNHLRRLPYRRSKNDGSRYAWGANTSGQLGDGTTSDRSSPAFIRKMTDLSGPVMDSLTSTTHPDQALWYANGSPALAWSANDINKTVGYSYVLDQVADTVPDTTIESQTASKSFAGKTDGVWHFHLRAVDGLDNWSATDTFTIQIDTTAPTTSLSSDSDWHPGGYVVTPTPSDTHSGMSGGRRRPSTPGTVAQVG